MPNYDLSSDFAGSLTKRLTDAINHINSTDNVHIAIPTSAIGTVWQDIEDELPEITGKYFTITGFGNGTRFRHLAENCSLFKVSGRAAYGEISNFYVRHAKDLTGGSANNYTFDVFDASNITIRDAVATNCAGVIRLGADDANSAISANRCDVLNVLGVTDQGHKTDGVVKLGNVTELYMQNVNASGGAAGVRSGANFKMQPQGGKFIDTVRMHSCDFQCRDAVTGGGLDNSLTRDRKPIGFHADTSGGKIVNTWFWKNVFDHCREYAYLIQIPAHEITGMHFDENRSSTYGHGAVIEHGSNLTSREISFMKQHFIWHGPNSNVLNIKNTSTGKFVDCDFDYSRISEVGAHNKTTCVDTTQCTGGWSLTNNKLKPRNPQQAKKTNKGLDLGTFDISTNNNDFSWAINP